jgi:hypothetical protein
MPQTLVPLATKWVPLAMVPRLPLAYLLCDNQPIVNWAVTGDDCQRLHMQTVPGQLEMYWSHAVASMSSLRASVARDSMSASAGARGAAPSQPPATLPAATSQDMRH